MSFVYEVRIYYSLAICLQVLTRDELRIFIHINEIKSGNVSENKIKFTRFNTFKYHVGNNLSLRVVFRSVRESFSTAAAFCFTLHNKFNKFAVVVSLLNIVS